MGDPEQFDPIDAFYGALNDLFCLDGRGVFGRLATYADTREEAVSLKSSTVRGWLKGRSALPAPDQLAAMLEYFHKRRLLDEEDVPELRELWEGAARHKKEKGRARPVPQNEDNRQPAPRPERQEPADPAPQVNERKRRTGRWVSIGGCVGATLALSIPAVQVLASAGRGESAKPIANPSAAPVQAVPSEEPDIREFSATVVEPSLCSIVIKDPARVYLAPDRKARIIESKPRNARVLVFDTVAPPGWRLVYSPNEASELNWMRADVLTAPTTRSSCAG